MDKLENRDDLIKKVIDQKQKTARKLLNTAERRKAEEYVKREIMPRVYEDR
jgi:hypothetical protein